MSPENVPETFTNSEKRAKAYDIDHAMSLDLHNGFLLGWRFTRFVADRDKVTARKI